MNTQNIHFHDKITIFSNKMSQNICLLELSEEFPRDSKRSSNQPQ